MKKSLCLAVSLLALNLMPVFGQPAQPARVPRLPNGNITINTGFQPDQPSALTKFNLDFPGGTAAQLVAAIEKAMGKPLNVIIASDEKSAKAKLPPIKVNDMDVARLFNSLERRENAGIEMIYSRRFYTEDQPPKDNSLWTFSVYEKQSVLTQFSLDFPGGTPADLVKAIEIATGKPMNVVIPDADADTKLPPLKMDNVDVAQLFQSLGKASAKMVAVVLGGQSYSTYTTGYGFKTEGQPTDNSVWYFHVDRPAPRPMFASEKVCQYYSLSPYLDRGFTVDDITTAIQTGWKMSGETSLPELNYHKETKLLIAYGEPNMLKTIENVLKTLPQANYPDLPSYLTMTHQIADLRELVYELNKKSRASTTNSAFEEKSGK
jgi:hypothetical protein